MSPADHVPLQRTAEEEAVNRVDAVMEGDDVRKLLKDFPPVLYHGTSLDRLAGISAEGLRQAETLPPGRLRYQRWRRGVAKGGVFLTDTEDMAARWARYGGAVGDVIVCRIDVGKLDQGLLYGNRDSMGSFEYLGDIPPNAMTFTRHRHDPFDGWQQVPME